MCKVMEDMREETKIESAPAFFLIPMMFKFPAMEWLYAQSSMKELPRRGMLISSKEISK